MTKDKLIEALFCLEKAKNHNAKVFTELRGNMKHSVLQLHDTEICIINWDTNRIYFDTGGWKTATTKNYMNLVISYMTFHNLKQSKGEWFFNDKIPYDHVDFLDLEAGLLQIKKKYNSNYIDPKFNIIHKITTI